MRLLQIEHNGDFSLAEYSGEYVPPYAILSHTWGADHQEVTFKDLTEGTGKDKLGYYKLSFSAKEAWHRGFQFFWVDTCCIDKSSSAELQEAINSMFQWYFKASVCFVYLSDVTINRCTENGWPSRQAWKLAFRKSRWFTRGWTLQELLAPKSVEFFSADGEWLGDKISMVEDIQEITGISAQALQGRQLSEFSVTERMSWAEHRKTKREEDQAYALLGIFDIHIPLIYSEGREKAFKRLWREIQESPNDDRYALPPGLSPQQSKRKGKIDGETRNSQRMVVCYKCGERGHYASDPHCVKCDTYGHSENDLHCYKCGEYGHYADEPHCFRCDSRDHLAYDCPL